MTAGPHYLVACCLTGREVAVQSWALERGFTAYVPMGAVVVRLGRSRTPVVTSKVRPVFPSYVFVRDDPRKDVFIDDPSSGVFAWLRLVRDELHGPVVVPEALIDELRVRERAGEFNGREAERPDFEVGETVEVLIGGRSVRGVMARRLKSGRLRLTGDELGARFIEVDEADARRVSCG